MKNLSFGSDAQLGSAAHSSSQRGLKTSTSKAAGRWLTGVGDGEAVGCLDVVHMRHQGERGFRGVGAGVV